MNCKLFAQGMIAALVFFSASTFAFAKKVTCPPAKYVSTSSSAHALDHTFRILSDTYVVSSTNVAFYYEDHGWFLHVYVDANGAKNDAKNALALGKKMTRSVVHYAKSTADAVEKHRYFCEYILADGSREKVFGDRIN